MSYLLSTLCTHILEICKKKKVSRLKVCSSSTVPSLLLDMDVWWLVWSGSTADCVKSMACPGVLRFLFNCALLGMDEPGSVWSAGFFFHGMVQTCCGGGSQICFNKFLGKVADCAALSRFFEIHIVHVLFTTPPSLSNTPYSPLKKYSEARVTFPSCLRFKTPWNAIENLRVL